MMMTHASKYVAAAMQAAKVKQQACSRFSGYAIKKHKFITPSVVVRWSRRECKTLTNVDCFESLDMPLYRRSRAPSLPNVVSRQFASAAGSGKEEELQKKKEELQKKEERLQKKEETLQEEKKELQEEKKELQKKEEAATNPDDKLFFRGLLQKVGGELERVGGQLEHVGGELEENSKQMTLNLSALAAIPPSPNEVLDELIGGSRLNVAAPSVEKLSPYTGRAEAIEAIRGAALRNFKHRSCNPRNTALLTFVNCPGHVRIGKTRTGEQAPQIIKDYVGESSSVFGDVSFLDPAYIFISFKNGAGYNASIDKRNGEDYGLGGRLLSAAFFDGHYSRIPKIADMHALDSARVFNRILDQALEGQPSDAVLPIVIHLDEYGHFVEKLKSDGISDKDARHRLKTMICQLAPIMGCYGSDLLDPFKGRYFVVPITTGTSFVDVSVGLSLYNQLTAALPVLSFEESEAVVRSKLTEKFSDTDVDSIMNNATFKIALGDAGGFPGFLEYLWTNAGVDSKNYVEILSDGVNGYISQADKPQGWSLVVQLALTCVAVPDRFMVSDTATITDLRDRGVVHLVNSGAVSFVQLAPVMMGRWDAPISAGSVVPDVSNRRPWKWYKLEECIIDYLQARLAALRTVSTHESLEWDEPGVATISKILPGAVFRRYSELPGTRLELDEIHGRGTKMDENWTIPSSPTEQREIYCIDRTDRNVHVTADDNPIVDGYVTLKKAGAEGTFTLFFQIRYSALSTKNPNVGVPMMNETKKKLDEALLLAPGWDVDNGRNGYALVFVSNRRVPESRTALAEDVGYISKGELNSFMGAFAHRGLLPPTTDTADHSH